MPRYNYECETCNNTAPYRLQFGQEPEQCILCESTGSFVKVYNKGAFIVLNNAQNDNEQPTGVLTKEYIEENKKILDKQKEEALSEEYEPT